MDRGISSQLVTRVLLVCAILTHATWRDSWAKHDVPLPQSVNAPFPTTSTCESYACGNVEDDCFPGSFMDSRTAPGRLGNKFFQNLAISIVARKFDLYTVYHEGYDIYDFSGGVDNFEELGIDLFSGNCCLRQLHKDEVILSSATLPHLLDPKTECPQVIYRAFASDDATWLQTASWAHMLLSDVIPTLQPGLLRANPWRDRAGKNNDLFVHLRLGDATQWTPRAVEDFCVAIKATKYDDIYVASDSLSHQDVRILQTQFGAKLFNASTVKTIQFGSLCKHIIVTDGTFGWMIAALSPPGADIKFLPKKGGLSTAIFPPEWPRF